MKVIYKSQKTYSKSTMPESSPTSKEKDHKVILRREVDFGFGDGDKERKFQKEQEN